MLLAPLLVPLLAACRQSEPPPPPRVVLVTLDTVRADHFGCYGSGLGCTPNLDRLAMRGVRFERAVAPMPETMPSHATLMTGRSPLSHGTTCNYLALSDEAATLAELLGGADVATGAFFNVMPFDEQNVAQGFSTRFNDLSVLATEVAPRCFEWLDSLPAGKPALAWMHYYIAHAPFEPPVELRERFAHASYAGPLDFSIGTILEQNRSSIPPPPEWLSTIEDRYAAEVALVDQRIGEIVAALRERGQLERTLLVVVGDHGESFRPGTVAQHSLSTREQTMRLPLIVSGPGVAEGAVASNWVAMADLFATLLQPFCVAAPAESVASRSLWPLLRGEEPEWDDVVFGSLPVSEADQKSGKLPDVLVAWSGRWKLLVIDVNKSPRGVLRDLEADPDEAKDFSKEHVDVVTGLERRVRRWLELQRAAALESGQLSEEARKRLKELGYGD